MQMVKKSIDLDVIRKLYLEENLSTPKIGKTLNLHCSTIQRAIEKMDIKKPKYPGKPINYIHIDKETLYELYITKDMTTREMAKYLNMSQVQVAAKLRESEIKKDPSKSKKIRRVIKEGDRKSTNDGYWTVYYPNHPNATKSGWVLEHRYIMSQRIGRPLTNKEVVHHINEDRKDNRIENLQLEASAGLHSLNHHRKILTKEELLQLIIDFVIKNGRHPMIKEMCPAYNLASYKTYRTYFGSTRNAIRLALNRLHDEHGA